MNHLISLNLRNDWRNLLLSFHENLPSQYSPFTFCRHSLITLGVDHSWAFILTYFMVKNLERNNGSGELTYIEKVS